MASGFGLPKKVKLKDGRVATISFLSEKDSVRELQAFINALVAERAHITYDRKVTLKEEKDWKKKRLANLRKRTGYLLVARVDGRMAGTSGGFRDAHKARNNVCLGIGLARGYRSVGLGEVLLRTNIAIAKRFLKPKNIYLSVLAPNKPARALYRKLGFKEFAVFPKWILHNGKYVDHVFMKL